VTSDGWVDANEAGGGFRWGLDRLQMCSFSGGSILIGGSVALAVGGSTSCVWWLNGVDPVVEWCGIEVLLWCGGCFFFVVVQWVGVGRDRRVRERPKSERETEE